MPTTRPQHCPRSTNSWPPWYKQDKRKNPQVLPGIFRQVANYCKTCDICQKGQRRRHLRQAEMISMPLIDQPFQRIAMDVVGPLPRSRSGNKYILTMCDYATRYPEAIALPSTEASRIAKELVLMFSRVGIPEEILTDQGSNFMSTLLRRSTGDWASAGSGRPHTIHRPMA